ncbi:hypothetical protein EJC51_04305 [Streptomyces aquilus]|uniref:Uncharacterized protein n=1 Tax=Streptomyces aquilus TaxID=2548456 RepID=A0A3Q9C7X5_9ACTN|nr:hypothetical protein EJC51_04305 [Streptomyces aquilus]
MDPTSLFSAPEGQPSRSTAVSPPPTISPFQAPDFGDAEAFWSEDAQAPAPGTGPARPKAA